MTRYVKLFLVWLLVLLAMLAGCASVLKGRGGPPPCPALGAVSSGGGGGGGDQRCDQRR